MREVKFRAWDKTTSSMCNIGALYFSRDYKLEGISTHLHNGYVINNNPSDTPLMQYTGVKDKNGTEIYEGDIVWDDILEAYGKVVFEDGAFRYTCENISEELFEGTDDIEVVGNIYENKSLLNGEK